MRPIAGHILKLLDALPRINVDVPPVGGTPAQHQATRIVRVEVQLQHFKLCPFRLFSLVYFIIILRVSSLFTLCHVDRYVVNGILLASVSTIIIIV